MKDDLFQPLVVSCALHIVLGVMFCSSLLSFKFRHNDEMEIELGSIGELDKDIGGTGQGEAETAQPMESTKEVIKESEILPEDKPEPEVEEKKEETPATPPSPPPAPEEPTAPTPDPEPNTPGETLPPPVVKEPEKKVEKKQPEPEKRKTEKIDRPLKRKKNAILDLLAKKKQIDSDFDDMLNDIGSKDKLKVGKRRHGASSKVKGEGGGGGGTALSSGNYDLVKKQVMPHWIVTDDKYVVRLKITVQDDGVINLSDIEIEDMVRYNTDQQYKVAVDSARRALIASSPLQLPKDVIRKLKNFTVVFDPRNAF